MNEKSQIPQLAAYALGHVESWLKTYCESHQISFPIVADNVGKALQLQAGGQILGLENPMPEMRDHPIAGHSLSSAMEMAGRTRRALRGHQVQEPAAEGKLKARRGPRTMSKAARKAISKAQIARWAKVHKENKQHHGA